MLVFDDATAFGYLNDDRAGSMSEFKSLVAERIGKEIEIKLEQNVSNYAAKDAVVDLRDFSAIGMEIEEEAFE